MMQNGLLVKNLVENSLLAAHINHFGGAEYFAYLIVLSILSVI